MKLKTVQVLGNGEAVKLQWADGLTARFHAVWLRDVALDPQTHSPNNGQRLITLLEMPRAPSILQGSIRDDGGLSVILAPENKEFIFPADWLRERIYDRRNTEQRGWLGPHIETWDSGLGANIPVASWHEVESDLAALGNWLSMVRRYGFAVLTHVPTASGDLCRVAERFGYVRHTNYGRWFEVRSEVNPSNLAFTNAGLQPHTDNPYRDPVPTLQLLSCLENSVEGGESIVVDGFRAAQRLRAASPRAFDLLSGYCARFEFAGQEDVLLRSKRPMIELAPDGELMGVRFNNRSAAPFVDIPYDEMQEFYAAYRRFAEIIEEPAMSVKFKLAPGELFIVDNTRVMHARTRFSGSGKRWLQGCYADKDGLLSTLAVIERKAAAEVGSVNGETLTRETVVPFLEDIVDRRGAESYLGEEVTMAEHMLQAALLAEQQGAPDELVAAALLHDIGHFTNEFGPYSPADTKDNYHDRAGARILAPFFPAAVTECIRLHVGAKRYLCATDPAYLQKLSAASVHSLSLQGGAMNQAEVAEFEQNPFHREAVRVRIWDDQGKVAGMRTKRFRDYTDLLRRVAS